MEEVMYGIEYSKPKVILLQETGIGTSELAGRSCYDSYDQSENKAIINVANSIKDDSISNNELFEMNNIKSSELLDKLAWVHFHHSVLEHASLTFFIEGTSRGVLQEHARHRIQSISVRSTRYTMQNILNVYIAAVTQYNSIGAMELFITGIKELNMFIINGELESLEIQQLFFKLEAQRKILGNDEFLKLALSKDALEQYNVRPDSEYSTVLELLNSSKNKRNVGDAFKWVVTDNWKVDMVVTFNLRSLKNYFTLRDSGAAYFQMRWLAQAMKKATPKKYLDLIVKDS